MTRPEMPPDQPPESPPKPGPLPPRIGSVAWLVGAWLVLLAPVLIGQLR